MIGKLIAQPLTLPQWAIALNQKSSVNSKASISQLKAGPKIRKPAYSLIAVFRGDPLNLLLTHRMQLLVKQIAKQNCGQLNQA